MYPIYNADGSYNESVPHNNIVLYQEQDQRKTRGNDIQGSWPSTTVCHRTGSAPGGLNFRQTRDTNFRSALIPGTPRTNGDLFEATVKFSATT